MAKLLEAITGDVSLGLRDHRDFPAVGKVLHILGDMFYMLGAMVRCATVNGGGQTCMSK